jgi:ParB-like chromosome segregation protein Spo0J
MSPKTQTKPSTTLAQPISRVEWLPRETLSANDWNPNKQAPPEKKLLKISILENGWTQPIVARTAEDGTVQIVDGFHRWLVSEDPDVYALTGGLVPVVLLATTDDAVARLATVRHNRARGTHYVVPMADIVADLLDSGMDPKEIGRRLGMDSEEVDRLTDRGVMTKRGRGNGFKKGWTV